MKKKVIIAIYLVLLVGMTLISSSVFCLNANHVDHVNLEKSNLRYNVGQLILYEGKQADPHYQYLSFSKRLSKKKRKAYTATMNKIMEDYTTKIRANDDLNYIVTNKKGEEIDQHSRPMKEKSLNVTLTYDQKGHVSGKSYTTLYQSFDSRYVDLFTSIGYNTTIQSKEIDQLTKAMDEGKVKINTPKNMAITIQVPQTLTTNYMRYLLNQSDQTVRYMSMAFFFCSLALILFMFVMPISEMENIEPFHTIKNWYLIVNVFIIGFALLFGITMIAEIFDGMFSNMSDSSIQMGVLNILGLSLEISNEQPFLYGLMSIPAVLIYFMISVMAFGLKYIIINIKTYFTTHTIIGAIIRAVKRNTNQLVGQILEDHYVKALSQLLLLHLALLVGITLVLGWFFITLRYNFLHPYRDFLIVWIFALAIYAYFVIRFIVKRVTQVKNSYDRLVVQAKDLSAGHFVEVKDDLGIFNGLRDEMNHVKDGFEKAVEEEVKSTTMKTELISNVSHDLKTPLTCIKNYVILLKDAKTPEDTKEYIGQIDNYTNRLSTLIEDLFEVSKVNSGNVTLHQTSLDLLSLLDQALVENEEKLEEKSLQVIKKADLESAICLLDGEKTYRIFDNLLGNIGKYAMPHTRVYMDITHDEKAVAIVMKNISEAEMNFTSEEIVERFVRGDKSRHVAGSGLGLAIAKSFTEVQGGQFELSIDGDMFKVTLTFPLEKDS